MAGLLQQSELEARRSAEAGETAAETEKRLLAHLEERKEVATEAAELERRIQEHRQHAAELEARLREARQGIEAVREQRRDSELARTRAEADRGHLDDLCRQELGFDVEEAAQRGGGAFGHGVSPVRKAAHVRMRTAR